MGDEGSAVAGLHDIILNPDAYNVLRFKHNFTLNGEWIETGFFIPAFRIVTKLLDKRGWCDPNKAKEFLNKERMEMASDPKGLLMLISEFCWTIEEAFSREGDNFFPKDELAQQLAAIDIYKTVSIPKRGFLTWDIDKTSGEKTGKVNWREDALHGDVLISEHPIKTEDQLDYKNLYVGGIDSIDIGTADSAQIEKAADGEKKTSDFCIVIKKRIFGLNEPAYVAMYKDRPKDPRQAFDNAAKLLTYYHCNAVLEATRTNILTYFRDRKLLHLLMKRPRATMPDVTRSNSNMYGSPATVKVIDHYRQLIYNFCLDYSHTITFREMLDQLLNYSDANKKKFDIVASLGMAELGDEELSLKKPEPREPQGKTFSDFGWFTNSAGYKEYGKIPKTEADRMKSYKPKVQDAWLYKDNIL